MQFRGVRLIAAGVLASASSAGAQEAGNKIISAPQPPPVQMVVAPPAPPSVLRADSIEDETARWGATPVQAPPPATLDKKILKQLRREQEQNRQACIKGGALKSWMAKSILAACDKLLAQAPPADAAGYYRAQILQRRALSLTILGGNRLAIAALDESDRLGAAANDGFFKLGIGVGNDLLRAQALRQLGKTDEAIALLGKVRAARPYASSIVEAADRLENVITPGPANLRRLSEARIPIDPEMLRVLFLIDLVEGRLEDAAQSGDQISLREPKMRGGWAIIGGPDEFETLDRQVVFGSLRAYVAAALGNRSKADALFAESRAAITDYAGPDPRSLDRRAAEWKVNQYLARVKQGEEAGKSIALAETLIALRQDRGALTIEGIEKKAEEMDKAPLVLPILVELMRQVEGRQAREAKATADMATRQMLAGLGMVDPGELAALLPKPESLDLVPKFGSSPSMLWFGGGPGWSQSKEGDGNIRTVRYETDFGSKAMMEEMLLLASAHLARQEGKDGFLVLASRSFARQTTMVSYWGGSSTYDSGFEAQARIQLVDTANLPPELAGQKGRIITAAQIERDLQPRYQSYFAERAAIKEAKKKAR
ncbi:hypothetical protein L7H23_07090 [Sphingopyxis sp. BSN-002]|uniref:hypothetical protein n=1 Tax=Sphingopyxis sp. BSN-002 TaxID=2911495 RepID=UPI001EDA8F26|nr:hypothetical protein [Sphingopyxis sp. BSN-002]UKK85861.1 hypothetical protein L7H23_07090 [Sphingopyxis sp. BSN-002]